MKKVLLLLIAVFAIAYAVHWYNDRNAAADAAATAVATTQVATPVKRKATPKPYVNPLDESRARTSNPKVNPLNAPHH